MKKFLVLVIALTISFSGVIFASDMGSGSTTAVTDKVAIQSIMLDEINLKMCPKSEICTIDGQVAQFDYLHDGVSEKDGVYVSCADFIAGSDKLDVDFYVEKNEEGYQVIKTTLHKKNGELINKVLWEEGHEDHHSGEPKGSGH